MKLFSVLILFAFFSPNALACSEISGKYSTVSESEWNYELSISNEEAVLRYSAHEHTDSEEIIEIEKTENGVCKNVSGKYVLSFNDKEFGLEYHSQLSHKSFGSLGASPGVIVEHLIPETKLEFWKEGTVK
jgi:hypothetical protein